MISFFKSASVSFVRYFDLRYPVPTLVPYSLHKVGKLNLSNDWNLKIVKTCFEAKSKNFFKMRNHVDFNEPNIGSNTKTHIFCNSELNPFISCHCMICHADNIFSLWKNELHTKSFIL